MSTSLSPGNEMSVTHTSPTHHQRHRSLGDPDIWLQIFDELEHPLSGPHTSIRMATLASLARVSRYVSEIALDALWRHLPGLRAFAAILSGKYQGQDGLSTRAEATSGLDRESNIYERLRYYGPRVRDIQSDDEDETTCVNALKYFAEKCPEHSLLPNLLSIDWGSVLRPSFLDFVTLLPPSLSRVKLTHIIAPWDTENRCLFPTPNVVLSTLFKYAPGMRELDFTTDQRCFAQSAGRIGSFEELTTVKLAGDRVADGNSLTVSPTLLKALAKLPALTTLALHAGHFDPTCHQVLLPQLRHLKFPCELCPLEVETTMSAILAPSLTSLQFYYIDAQDPPDARRYLEMFAKYYPSTLSELTIYLGMDGQGDTQLVDLLAPLHSFPVLTKLSCNLRSLVNVTFIDRDVQTLGEAWPQMSQLELLYLQRAKPALSAQCFGNFTHYFPHLQTLALSSVDLDSDLPSSKDIRTHHRLNSLTIGLILTTAEDPNLKAFANLLFTIYPRLPDLQFALITEQQAWVFVTFEREIVDS